MASADSGTAVHRQWYVGAIAVAGGDGGARKGSSWPQKPGGTQAMLGETLDCPIHIEKIHLGRRSYEQAIVRYPLWASTRLASDPRRGPLGGRRHGGRAHSCRHRPHPGERPARRPFPRLPATGDVAGSGETAGPGEPRLYRGGVLLLRHG